MNPTIDVLMQRKSIRAYTEQPIPEEAKQAVLQAAQRAPTAGNMQLYSILEVADQALKDMLAITCDNQPFIAKAPWVLLFLADYQRWYDYYLLSGVEAYCQAHGLELRRPEEGDLFLAACDTLIAAHTAVVAAEALGIGSCYIGDIVERYETHRRLFDLPQYALPVALVCFGFPTPGQASRNQTKRFDPQYILHTDRYRRVEADGLDAMFQARDQQFKATGHQPEGVENLGQFNYYRKFSAEFSIEMSRSMRAMIRSWKAAPRKK